MPFLSSPPPPFRGPCEHVVFLFHHVQALCSSLFADIWSWNPTFWQMFQNFLNLVFHATNSKFHDFFSKWCNTQPLYNPKNILQKLFFILEMTVLRPLHTHLSPSQSLAWFVNSSLNTKHNICQKKHYTTRTSGQTKCNQKACKLSFLIDCKTV